MTRQLYFEKRLYRKLEHKFRKDGVRMVIADTEADNEEAIAFFKTMGFAISARYVWLGKTLRRPVKKADDAEHSRASTPKPQKSQR